MTTSTDISIRPAVKADMIEVCDLLRDLGLTLPPKTETQKIRDHINRMWDENPYYEDFNEPVFYGWVLLHQEEIVGFFGSIPRVYFLNGKKIPVSVGSNWGVKKEYRLYTAKLCDVYFKENPIALRFATTAIKPSGKIYERYGGKRAPEERIEDVYMIPFSLGKLMKLRLQNSKLKWATPLMSISSLLPVWKWHYMAFSIDKNLQEVQAEQLPSGFDLFWKTYLGQTKGFIASHEANAMKWVYGHGKRDLIKKVYVYRNAMDQIMGYTSLITEPVPGQPDIKRMKIGDLLALTKEVKRSMLRGLIALAYRMKADVLEVHLPCNIQKSEIPAFSLQRKVPSFPVFYQTDDPDVERILSLKENWHISPYDGDTSLG